MGSAAPISCPTNFVCKGAAEDLEYGGSQPQLVGSGFHTKIGHEVVNITTDTYHVVSDVSLQANIEDVDLRVVEARVAAALGVEQWQVSFQDPAAGSVVLRVDVVAADNDSAAAIQAAYDALCTGGLLSIEVGFSSNCVSSPAIQMQTLVVQTNRTTATQESCGPGTWCAGGAQFLCEQGYYNPSYEASSQSSCIMCPLRSTTLRQGATSIEE